MSKITQPLQVANQPVPTTLETALVYARAGFKVIPLKPGQKTPLINGWRTAATTNEKQITAWFEKTANNIGITTGEWAGTNGSNPTWVVVVDIDMHGDIDGKTAMAKLINEHGELDERGTPFTANTAMNGVHHLFLSTVPLDNSSSNLPDGIDIRGVGGFVMVAPSTHPDNGKQPVWVNMSDFATRKPGLIPQWLVDLIQHEPEPPPTQATKPNLSLVNDQPSPGDLYNQNNTFKNLLWREHWQAQADYTENGQLKTPYTRPGKQVAKGEHSAVLNHNAGEYGVLTIFSTSVAPGLLLKRYECAGGHHAHNPFSFYSAMHFGGDQSAAAKAYLAEHRALEQSKIDRLMGTDKTATAQTVAPAEPLTENDYIPGQSYVFKKLSELIGVDIKKRVPDLLLTPDSTQGFLYSNSTNLVAGSAGSMKSWISAFTALQQIQLGKHVVIIDYELQMDIWFTRLRVLGATDEQLEYVRYCAPDEPLRAATVITKGLATGIALEILLEQISKVENLPGGLALVIIDGVNQGMTQNALKLLDNTDIAMFWELLPTKIVKQSKACVVLNDHVAKNAQGDTATPLGGVHKTAITSGAVHITQPIHWVSHTPLTTGVVNLRCIKDRHGGIGQHAVVAQLVFTPHSETRMTAVVNQVAPETEHSTENLQPKVLAAIRQIRDTGQKATTNQISNMSAISDKAKLGKTLQDLEKLGQIKDHSSRKTAKTPMDWRLTDTFTEFDF